MKIYDTHSDVFSNLYERKLQNKNEIFKNYHSVPMTKGEIVGGIWVVYSEHDFNIHEAYEIALNEFANYKKDFDVIYGLEGLRNVHTLDDFDKLHQMGIRHASLTWNEKNHLATGVAGDKDSGLTKQGKEFLDYMMKQNMIIDVSHLNVKSFYDVLDYSQQNIIASHSNAYALSDHRRNLNDEQLKRIREVGGFVGAVSARNFVSKNPLLQNVQGMADQIIYLAEHIGIDHVMLGLDIMDYLGDYEGENSNLDDLKGHGDAQNLINELLKRNLNYDEVEMVAYKNFLKLKQNIDC